MALIVQQEGFDPGLPIFEETLLDPEADREVTFRANSQHGIEELVEAHWGAPEDGDPSA